jgi:magnesium transporter
MLNIFMQQPQGLARTTPGLPPKVPEEAIWLDLLEPTPEEEKLVERELGIDVPTREEMKEIETSNRLYEDNGALYMTTTVAAQLDTDRPVGMAVTFILTGTRLVTNRYLDTKPFQQFITYAENHAASRRPRARRRRPRQSLGQHLRPARQRYARQS